MTAKPPKRDSLTAGERRPAPVRCTRCGHEWTSRARDDVCVRCPACKTGNRMHRRAFDGQVLPQVSDSQHVPEPAPELPREVQPVSMPPHAGYELTGIDPGDIPYVCDAADASWLPPSTRGQNPRQPDKPRQPVTELPVPRRNPPAAIQRREARPTEYPVPASPDTHDERMAMLRRQIAQGRQSGAVLVPYGSELPTVTEREDYYRGRNGTVIGAVATAFLSWHPGKRSRRDSPGSCQFCGASPDSLSTSGLFRVSGGALGRERVLCEKHARAELSIPGTTVKAVA